MIAKKSGHSEPGNHMTDEKVSANRAQTVPAEQSFDDIVHLA